MTEGSQTTFDVQNTLNEADIANLQWAKEFMERYERMKK